MNTNITGRDGYITSQSLLYAIAHIQSLPAEKQEYSNMCDMCMIAREKCDMGELAMFAHSVFAHTGVTIDIWPDAEEETIPPKSEAEIAEAQEYRLAFNATLQDLRDMVAKRAA